MEGFFQLPGIFVDRAPGYEQEALSGCIGNYQSGTAANRLERENSS